MKYIVSLILLIVMISIVFALPTNYNPWTGKLDFFGLEDDIRSVSDFSTVNLTVDKLTSTYINLSGDQITIWNDLNAIVVNISDNDTFVSLNPKQGQALTWDEATTRYLNDYIQANYSEIDDKAGYFVSTTVEGALGQLANEVGGGTIPGTNTSSDWQDSVLSITTYTPPASPSHNDRYIVPFAVSGDWYSASWTYRQTITIDPTYITSNQTNYPIALVIDSGANKIFSHALANGDDIVFTSSDKTTLIPFELVYYNNDTGTEYIEAHISIPLVTSDVDTEFYMYYGNAGATSLENRTGVWDSDYKLVLHMQNYNATYLNGSTSYLDYGLLEDSPTETTGIMHNAQYFSGGSGNGWVNTSVDDDLSSGSFTVSSWLKDADTTSAYIISQTHTFGGYSSDFIYGYKNGGLWMRSQQLDGGSIIGDGDWHRLDMVFNGTDAKILIDGAQYGSTIHPVGFGGVGNVNLMTRGDAYIPTRKSGIMDEVKISVTDRSDDYLNISYQNVHNMDSFFTIGSETLSSTAVTNWTGYENNITTWNELITNWTFETPQAGWAVIVEDEGLPYWWNSTQWKVLTSSISHKSLNDLLGVDEENNGWHLTSSQWVTATRLATNALSGLMPSGKMDYWDTAWHIGDVITQDVHIREATPSIVWEDSSDDTAYRMQYNSGSGSYMRLSKGILNETTFDEVSGDADLEIDGTLKANSVIANGASYSGELISGQANLFMYVLSNTTSRLISFDGADYYDLAMGDWNGGNPNIMLKKGGKVGINVGNPTEALHVSGAGKFGGTVYIDNTTNIRDFESTYNASYVPYTGASSDVDLGSNDLTAENVEATKNINATETLKGASSVIYGSSYSGELVGGQANLISYIISNSTGRILSFDGVDYYDLAIGDWNGGNPNIMLKAGGKVGINVGAPEQSLDVSGAGKFGGTIYIENTTDIKDFASTYNETYLGSVDNSSYLSTYNESYDSWSYNQTTIANTYTDEVNASQSTWINDIFLTIVDAGNILTLYYTKAEVNGFNDSWSTTYNETYAGSVNNESYLSTYNATYDKWAYNQTYGGSTYNATYELWSYNQSNQVNNSNTLDGYDSSYFMPLNTSVADDFTFAGKITNTGNTSLHQLITTTASNGVWKLMHLEDNAYGGVYDTWFGFDSTNLAINLNRADVDVFGVSIVDGAITSLGSPKFGNTADTTITLSPTGATTGTFTWMEDEGYLASDNIFLRDNNSIIFNRADGSHNISSSGISQVDFNFEFANIAFNSNNPVKFNTAVNITGNLEVGGTFNLEDLTVNDLIQAERIIIATDENTILFADDSFGVTRFGVGTKAPVRTLDVNGTADIYEDLYVQDDIILTDDMTLGGDIISAGSYRTNNTVALQFDTLQSEWAFAYNGALTGGTNTGLYFDAVGGEVGFKYLNNYIWKTSLLGTTTTHGIGFDADMVFSPTGTNTGSFKWWEDEDYFKTPNNWIFDENITVGSGSSYVNYGVCYYTSGQLGHCSTTMNATGGCTCVAN